MEKKSLKSVLSRHEFLKGLPAPYLDLLTGCAKNTRTEAGKLLFQAGESADRFYLIRQGRVAVELHAKPHRPVAIQTLGPDELLGWSWLIPPYRWHLSARAMEPVAALSFDGRCIRAKFDKDPKLGYEFYRRFALIMSQRLEETFLQMLGICG
jgi:CRP-like cAMP-binding protein